jgi:hypothetical protein
MAPAPTPVHPDVPARWGSRIGWLILIWAASVFTLGVAATAFRHVMTWVGLSR